MTAIVCVCVYNTYNAYVNIKVFGKELFSNRPIK